jgi:LacI family transcriptional regulator
VPHSSFTAAYPPPGKTWRAPTIRELARATGLGTATIDRVLNNRGGVREATRHKVHEALALLSARSGGAASAPQTKIAFLSEAGGSFNRSLGDAISNFDSAHPELICSFTKIETGSIDPLELSGLIESLAEEADGLVLAVPDGLAISRAVRAVMARGTPVVCVTTDLPTSNRLAYVGSDQTNAGATAAYLMARLLCLRPGKLLLVVSAPFRCQEERELGFRRVLRSEFPQLEVEERVSSHDTHEQSYIKVRDYILEHGAPAGIYNVAAGNVGVARALREVGLQDEVVFIAHELNANSRMLLESSVLDIVIGHDLTREVSLSAEAIVAYLRQEPLPAKLSTEVCVFTKYNCN